MTRHPEGRALSTRTVTIEVTGMHCASCGLLIDDCLEDVDGVVSAATDVRRGRCEAVVDADVADQALLDAVAEAGYEGSVLAIGASPDADRPR